MKLDKFLLDLDQAYLEAQDKAATAHSHPGEARTPEDRARLADRTSYQYLNGFQDGMAAVKTMLYKALSAKS